MGDKEKSTSICYVKFSGKGSNIKMLSLARRKKFDVYLLEQDAADNYKNGNAIVRDQLVLSLSGT